MDGKLILSFTRYIKGLDKKSLYFDVISHLKSNLEMLSPNIKVSKYDFFKKFVSIEIYDENVMEYLDIDITDSNLEIRGDGFELMFFLDDNLFRSQYRLLIDELFKGRYEIFHYFTANDDKIGFEFFWQRLSLRDFNKKIEYRNRKIENTTVKSGLKLVN